MDKNKKSLEEVEWDKKRIAYGVVLLFLFFAGVIGVKKYILGDNLSSLPFYKIVEEQVKGVSTQNNENLGFSNKEEAVKSKEASKKLQSNLQEKLDSLKREVNNLDISDLGNSSPQMKKVIEDIQNLQQLPRNQAKEACYSICKGI